MNNKKSYINKIKNNNPRRIALIGSAGVGKTTLLNKLKDNVDLQIIEEQARVICKELGYKNIYDIKDPTKFRFLVLKKQIEAEEKLNQFISDRSTIDCWIYFLRWSYQEVKTYEAEKYYNLSFNQSKKYSDIIYIPRMFRTKDDNFRWADNDYQNQIDRLIRETLREWGLMKRTYIVQSKDLKERVKEVKDYLNNC